MVTLLRRISWMFVYVKLPILRFHGISRERSNMADVGCFLPGPYFFPGETGNRKIFPGDPRGKPGKNYFRLPIVLLHKLWLISFWDDIEGLAVSIRGLLFIYFINVALY